ncbi:MAG TPA: hypothetical protein VFA60_04685 [Terriglobales bacterium]|nr:hypothetical protein [Terriglobales bacterium]
MKHIARFLSLLLISFLPVLAQQPAPPPAPAAAPAAPKPAPVARPGDVDSIDHIIAALYDVISGPAGSRDWDRLRSLFIPEARLIPTVRRPDGISYRALTVEEYIARAGANFQQSAFYESEVSRVLEHFGSIAHAFSTYESRHDKAQPPFARGINSIQLFNDGKRWWVVTIFWDSERPESPLPAEYLKGGTKR